MRRFEFISVIIPIYRSEKTITELIARLDKVLQDLDMGYEIICVDDCSPDNSWGKLVELKKTYNQLKLIQFSKNYGQHLALFYGLKQSKGDVCITIDDDLQHFPEDISKLLSAFDSDTDLVIATFSTKKHSKYKNITSKLVEKILISRFNLPHTMGLTSYRAVARRVVDKMQMLSMDYYITADFLSHTNRVKNVEVEHAPRQEGVSNYSIKKSFQLFFILLFYYTYFPIYLGILLMLLCILSHFLDIVSAVLFLTTLSLVIIFLMVALGIHTRKLLMRKSQFVNFEITAQYE